MGKKKRNKEKNLDKATNNDQAVDAVNIGKLTFKLLSPEQAKLYKVKILNLK